MRPALIRQLMPTFPRLFVHGDGVYPFRCRNGWYQLISNLATQLSALEPPDADLQVTQVKETFGGLRFYTRSVLSTAGQQAIEEAEARSFMICEACGAPGALQRGRRWLRMRCPNDTALDDV
jgi:hypothetical protein